MDPPIAGTGSETPGGAAREGGNRLRPASVYWHVMGRRLAVFALVVVAALAGVPVTTADCSPGDGCPMAGVGCAPRGACASGAAWSVAMTCCDRATPPATGPAAAATLTTAAAATTPLAVTVERVSEPPAPAPTTPSAERSRAERRHAVGLFTLFLVLLN